MGKLLRKISCCDPPLPVSSAGERDEHELEEAVTENVRGGGIDTVAGRPQTNAAAVSPR